jgi:hypothetical protein
MYLKGRKEHIKATVGQAAILSHRDIDTDRQWDLYL